MRPIRQIGGSGGGGLFDDYALFQCQRAAGTDDGTATAGSWELRTVNTTVVAGCGVTLAANVFTLPFGYKYLLRAMAPCKGTSRHQARINDTTATVTYPGSSMHDPSTYSGMNRSEVNVVLDLTAEVADHDIQVESRVAVTNAGDGHGTAVNFDEVEVYTQVEVWRFAV